MSAILINVSLGHKCLYSLAHLETVKVQRQVLVASAGDKFRNVKMKKGCKNTNWIRPRRLEHTGRTPALAVF